jgi:histidine triad (HIT) family protein
LNVTRLVTRTVGIHRYRFSRLPVQLASLSPSGDSIPAQNHTLRGSNPCDHRIVPADNFHGPDTTVTTKTLFQRIADREVPAQFVHEDDVCFAIRDINPQAPVHLLIVPRKPIPSLDDLVATETDIVGHLFLIAQRLAASEGLSNGYRTVFNCGEHGQQTVPHLHLHLLGGRQMSWPPG